jgi:molybdopterin converting factor small subunit
LISVRFLGGLRESLECELLLLPATIARDTDELKERLSLRGSHWSAMLENPQLLLAVNGMVRHASITLDDGDEVAFFPPVTGG